MDGGLLVLADDDAEEFGWCRVCDKRDPIDQSGVRPKCEDLNDLAEFVPVADAVDDPVGGDDVSTVPESEEGFVFAAGPELGDPESGDDPCEVVDPPSSAAAMPGLLAIAAPTPSATANAPILPINRPRARFPSLEYGVVAKCESFPCSSSRPAAPRAGTVILQTVVRFDLAGSPRNGLRFTK